jgi:hypothetical protein
LKKVENHLHHIAATSSHGFGERIGQSDRWRRRCIGRRVDLWRKI